MESIIKRITCKHYIITLYQISTPPFLQLAAKIMVELNVKSLSIKQFSRNGSKRQIYFKYNTCAINLAFNIISQINLKRFIILDSLWVNKGKCALIVNVLSRLNFMCKSRMTCWVPSHTRIKKNDKPNSRKGCKWWVQTNQRTVKHKPGFSGWFMVLYTNLGTNSKEKKNSQVFLKWK